MSKRLRTHSFKYDKIASQYLALGVNKVVYFIGNVISQARNIIFIAFEENTSSSSQSGVTKLFHAH